MLRAGPRKKPPIRVESKKWKRAFAGADVLLMFHVKHLPRPNPPNGLSQKENNAGAASAQRPGNPGPGDNRRVAGAKINGFLQQNNSKLRH